MPLKTIALGVLVVLVDIKINGFDLVPDPIGWVIVLRALPRMPSTTRWAGWLRAIATASLVLSVPAWFLAAGTAAVDDPSLVVQSFSFLVTLLTTAFTALLCAALAGLAQRAGDTGAAHLFSVAAALDVLTTLLIPVAWLAGTVGIALLALGGFAVIVWILVLLFTNARRPWVAAA